MSQLSNKDKKGGKIRTHYDNLMVARNASEEVIRAAFKTLTQKYHPDRNSNSEESERIMKILNESYGALSDIEEKRKHDKWIFEQEGKSVAGSEGFSFHSEEKEATRSNADALSPVSGSYLFSELSNELKYKVLSRLSGINRNQMAVRMAGVWWRYFGLLILSFWFVFLFNDASSFRWSLERGYAYMGITSIVSILIARNLHWVLFWSFTRLGVWLIVTPLYIIKTEFNRIFFWPILSVSDMKINYNYKRGIYKDNSLTVFFDGKPEKFKIRSQPELQGLLNKLNVFDQTVRGAITQNNVDYLTDNDDFLELRLSRRKSSPEKWNYLVVILIYLTVFSASGYFNYQLLQLNRERPLEPVTVEGSQRSKNEKDASLQAAGQSTGQSTDLVSITPWESSPAAKKPWEEPDYRRPALAPNGLIWPSKASYLKNIEKLNMGGLSKVTIDNRKNNLDIFVKLTFLDDAMPYSVRSFYIPADEEFTLEDIRSGNYDLRYKVLDSGSLFRSESFLLEETLISEGYRYSDITVSISEMSQKNRPVYTISEKEF